MTALRSYASAFLIASLASACSTSSGSSSLANDGGAGDATTVNDGSIADSALHFEASSATPTALAITPSTAKLTVTDPTKPPNQALQAMATLSDGTKTSVAASWTVDRPDIASVDAASGLVTASGTLGGVAIVTATVGTLTATATITVNLQLVIDMNPATSPTSAATMGALRAASGADPSVKSILYPYDKTVFPTGLGGPDVMWNGGAVGDAYRLAITGPSISVEIFGNADPPSDFTVSDALWNTLEATVTSAKTGADVSVQLARLPSGAATAFTSASETWHIANANVRGTIYYWAVDKGEIVRIQPGAAAPDVFFDLGSATSLDAPTPLNSTAAPSPPWQDVGTGQRCVACHSVSRDGSHLASIVSTPRGSTGPAGIVTIGAGAITAISDYTQNGEFTSLTPNGLKTVLNTSDFGLHLLDSTSGAAIPTTLDALVTSGFKGADPSFSNDGKSLAFSQVTTGGYPVEFSQADLAVFGFDDASNTFTGPTTIVASTGPGDAIAWPSFSPDSQWIFFQRGSYSRAKYGAGTPGNYFHGVDDLYVTAATPGSTPIALTALNSAGLIGDNVHLNYQPTVNPIAVGGYFWIVFVSPRDYGNKIVSPQGVAPADCTYSNHKQLWVAAVDADMKAVDPSHPAFRLPGQALATVNMNGFWTLAPCLPTPADGGVASCTAGFECCSGFCRDTGAGPSCVAPPAGCHNLGEACTTGADCCDGAACIGGFCTSSKPS